MKKVLTLIGAASIIACNNKPSIPTACQPDTTRHSTYSFVDAQGNFINNGLLIRMYDASNKLAGYAIGDSCTEFNQAKTVSDLMRKLKAENMQLFQKLMRGEINACDTTNPANHKLESFVPVEG